MRSQTKSGKKKHDRKALRQLRISNRCQSRNLSEMRSQTNVTNPIRQKHIHNTGIIIHSSGIGPFLFGINKKGNNITFLAYNESTGGATYGDTPGANQYYEENAATEIAAAKARGDLVLVDVQYYECSNYDTSYENTACDYANSSAGDQVGFFQHLIDLGADIVVGTSAHQPQTFELYNDGVIYYGLGNLFFDQIWWPGTTRSLMLEHYFYNDKLLQTRITPTVYDDSMQTELMDKETSEWFIRRLVQARP